MAYTVLACSYYVVSMTHFNSKATPTNDTNYRAAVWIGYYQLFPDIIGYFPYNFKIHELPGGKMYGNNGKFYGGTKI